MEHICFNNEEEYKAHKAVILLMYTIKKFKILKGVVHILAKPKLLPQL
jgi:hypothetical protein